MSLHAVPPASADADPALRQAAQRLAEALVALLAALRADLPPPATPPAPAALRELEGLPALVPAWPDAARLLGVSRNRMYELMRVGRVPALRLGRRAYVRRADLARLLGAGAGGT